MAKDENTSLKILWNIPEPSKPKYIKPYTKREKRIGFGTIAGAGLGFSLGLLTAGTGGFFLGVPLGAIGGNILTRKRYKPTGRPSKIKFGLWDIITNPRDTLSDVRKSRLKTMRKIAKVHDIRHRSNRLYRRR